MCGKYKLASFMLSVKFEGQKEERGFLGTFCTSHSDCHWPLIMSINLVKQPIDKPIKHQFFHYEALRLAGRVSCLIDTLVLNRACLTSPLTTWLVKDDTVHRNTMQSEICPAHTFWPGSRPWSRMKMATGLEYCDEEDLLTDEISEERDPNFVEERFRVDRRKLEQMLQGQVYSGNQRNLRFLFTLACILLWLSAEFCVDVYDF